MPTNAALLAVLADVRAYLARPGNDFSWSSFGDVTAALEEIDELAARVRGGEVPFDLRVLFAPTGPIQEVALSSGWGDEFLLLADRFDTAAAA
jgi:hypothetical protein